MTRGRPATIGVDDAVAIARKRGCVMKIVYGLESTCDLFIRTATSVVFVKTRRTDKILATVQEVEHACRDMIATLRLFPLSAQILLELWIYSKHGTYRFFRIRESGLVELDRDGMPVDQLLMTGMPTPAVSASDNEESPLPVFGGEEIIGSPRGDLSS